MRLRHFQCGEGVGAVQSQLAAIQTSGLDEPLGVELELGKAHLHVVFLFDREVGHDADHL